MASSCTLEELSNGGVKLNPSIPIRKVHTETVRALAALVDCQTKIKELDDEKKNEIEKTQLKYCCFSIPHSVQRDEIIEDIPNFWFIALLRHPELSLLMDEEEQDCLWYLNQIEVAVYGTTGNGYCIYLRFNNNPYFSNTCLYKEYQDGDSVSYSDPIEWHDGQDITQKDKLLSTRVGKYGETYQNSFFAWYNNRENPTQNTITDMIINQLWKDPIKYIVSMHNYSGESSDDDSST